MSYLQNRENIEWTNCWWSKANKDISRILLIGDSVIRNVRGEFEKCMLGQYAVDLFATSLDINDSLFWKHMKLYMDTADYTYECIILQYGFHHGWHRKCADSETDKKDFRMHYIKLLELLGQYCPNIVLMTGNSEMRAEQPCILDKEKEREIICRNTIVATVGIEIGCRVFDMYTMMHKVGNDYKYVDAQHYERSADLYIAHKLYAFLNVKELVDSDKIMKKKREYQDIYNILFGQRKNIVIYGSGNNGKKLFLLLKRYFDEIESIRFAESYPEGGKQCLDQKVIRIDEVSMEDKRNAVLVLSSPDNYEIMQKKARELNFMHILLYDDILNSIKGLEEDYYK